MVDLAVSPHDAHCLRAKTELDPLASVRGGEEFRGRRAHDPPHDPVGQFQDPDGLPLAARDRGEFEPDKAGADDNDVIGGGEPLAQFVGLREVSQIRDAVELDPGQRRHPVARPGRQDEVVVAEPLS